LCCAPPADQESLEREIWEEGQWDRRPGSPRSIASRGGVGFHLALVDDDCFELVPGRPGGHRPSDA
jgi:hypothetical protein